MGNQARSMASPLCQGRLRWEGSLLPSHSGYGPATKLPTLTQSLVRDRWQRGPCQQTSHSHALQRCRSRGLVPCSYCCATDFWLAKSHCKMRCSSRAPSLSEELCPPLVTAFPARSSSMGAALCDSSTRPCWLCPLLWDVLLGDRALGERSHPARLPQQHTVSLLSSSSSGELSIVTGIN